MKKLLVVLIVLITTIGCLEKVPIGQTVVQPQPVIEQSTTGVTQYDYQAGKPEDYAQAEIKNSIDANPYLVPRQFTQFPILVGNDYSIPWLEGAGYYVPPTIVYTVIYQGSVIVSNY